jgi:hypothetical protein
MLPLMLGKIIHDERQRAIEEALERRRLLAPVDLVEVRTSWASRAADVPAGTATRAARLAQEPSTDPICPTA